MTNDFFYKTLGDGKEFFKVVEFAHKTSRDVIAQRKEMLVSKPTYLELNQLLGDSKLFLVFIQNQPSVINLGTPYTCIVMAANSALTHLT